MALVGKSGESGPEKPPFGELTVSPEVVTKCDSNCFLVSNVYIVYKTCYQQDQIVKGFQNVTETPLFCWPFRSTWRNRAMMEVFLQPPNDGWPYGGHLHEGASTPA